MSETLEIQTPRVFAPLLAAARYKGVHGGRGSGKSHFFAEMMVEKCMIERGTRAVCIRENQKSLEQSVKRLIEDKIQALGLGGYFEVQDKLVKTPGDGLIIFQGMQNHTADSIKSLEGYDVAWVEEAQSLSAYSLRLLRPTLRKPNSELWFSWNPESPDDPVDHLLRGPKAMPNACVKQANWRDNPWFPAVLEGERRVDLARDQDEYHHVWEGGYVTISDALIFKSRVVVKVFETPTNARFYHGADWGFSSDPTVLVRCYIDGETLYVDQEAYGHGVELDEIPVLFGKIPTARDWPIKADCSLPSVISHVRNKGFPKLGAADKWSGSVEDGVACLKGFKQIVVHERCVQTAKEFRLYSYKVDKKTDPPEILPIIVDKHNHCIDALRYALDGYVQARAPSRAVRINLIGR
jgi:phage terminase large subunit